MAQRFYNLIKETGLELSWSIMAIEAQYPALKTEFDMERAAYTRIHSQWQIEDEAAQSEQTQETK